MMTAHFLTSSLLVLWGRAEFDSHGAAAKTPRETCVVPALRYVASELQDKMSQ